MRGLFAHGKESPNLYVCWHGSNNEFDWDSKKNKIILNYD